MPTLTARRNLIHPSITFKTTAGAPAREMDGGSDGFSAAGTLIGDGMFSTEIHPSVAVGTRWLDFSPGKEHQKVRYTRQHRTPDNEPETIERIAILVKQR